MSHTPGPWNVYIGEGADVISVTKWIDGRNGGKMAISLARMPVPTEQNRLSQEEINANGSLIKAAPDLLAALKLALRQLRDISDVLNQPNHMVYGWHLNGAGEPAANFFESNDHGAIAAAEAAIARAEGT